MDLFLAAEIKIYDTRRADSGPSRASPSHRITVIQRELLRQAVYLSPAIEAALRPASAAE